MSIFHSVDLFFKKVFTSAPNWTKAAQVAVTVIAPVAESLAAYAGGAEAGSEAAGIASLVTTDLGVVSETLTQLEAQPQNGGALQLLRNSAESIKGNLPGLLQLAEVKNPEKKQEITLAANTILGELEAILQVLPAAAPAAR